MENPKNLQKKCGGIAPGPQLRWTCIAGDNVLLVLVMIWLWGKFGINAPFFIFKMIQGVLILSSTKNHIISDQLYDR